MKSNEVRVGNWANDVGSIPFQIDGTDIVALIQSEKAGKINIHYNPIELTEEWLIKLGFEKRNIGTEYESWSHVLDGVGVSPFQGKHEKDNSLTVDNTSFTEDESDKGFYIELYYCYIHIRYVHQLQNVFYSLAGEELDKK